MSYTFEELRKKNVNELREIAKGIEHEAVQGYTQLNKEHLLGAICKALNIDMHIHHKIIGLDKKRYKVQIKELKKRRDEAIADKDHKKLKSIRRQIHNLKRTLKKATI